MSPAAITILAVIGVAYVALIARDWWKMFGRSSATLKPPERAGNGLEGRAGPAVRNGLAVPGRTSRPPGANSDELHARASLRADSADVLLPAESVPQRIRDRYRKDAA